LINSKTNPNNIKLAINNPHPQPHITIDQPINSTNFNFDLEENNNNLNVIEMPIKTRPKRHVDDNTSKIKFIYKILIIISFRLSTK